MPTHLDERATAGRAAALVLALAWSTVGFATTDLWVVIPPAHPDFAGADAMLEAGWGIYLSCLVVVPLLALMLRPGLGRPATRQLTVVTAATVPAAALSLDATFLLFGAALALTTLVQAATLRGRRRRRRLGPDEVARPGAAVGGRLTACWAAVTVVVFVGLPWVGFMRTSGEFYPAGARNGAILLAVTVAAAWLLPAAGAAEGRAPSRPLQLSVRVLTVLGAVPWSVYALELSAHGRERVPYLTNNIDHWPAQAAFAVALVAVPTAALAGWGSVRMATWTCGLAACALGAFSMLYPDAGGSLGSTWGAVALGWGVALALTGAVRAVGRRTRQPGDSEPAVHLA
ncbi:hypothetical protein [Georgenia subflava]|uniref:Uncharacterized protein n=1 Tax=Georgenia subflava TaxID=1622177 RepID=A0A6N7EIE3_9MICO|nr:hypothetical protein [Georgenia subflava]MPV37840.1 hypothetical protein [Georgenia subflava]